MPNLKKCLRTCIFCRGKFEQNELLRFKCLENRLLIYDYNGRSFYICKPCKEEFRSMKNSKKFEKALKRECKNTGNYVTQLEEILLDVR